MASITTLYNWILLAKQYWNNSVNNYLQIFARSRDFFLSKMWSRQTLASTSSLLYYLWSHSLTLFSKPFISKLDSLSLTLSSNSWHSHTLSQSSSHSISHFTHKQSPTFIICQKPSRRWIYDAQIANNHFEKQNYFSTGVQTLILDWREKSQCRRYCRLDLKFNGLLLTKPFWLLRWKFH